MAGDEWCFLGVRPAVLFTRYTVYEDFVPNFPRDVRPSDDVILTLRDFHRHI